MFIVKCGAFFVSQGRCGKPGDRATQYRHDAHVFASRAEACAFAPIVFGLAWQLAATEIIAAAPAKAAVPAYVSPLDRAIARGDNWTNREDADEAIFGVH